VIRMGARVVSDGSLCVLSTEPLEGTPRYTARSEETLPKAPPGDSGDWHADPRKIELRAHKARAALVKRVLRPRQHELAVKVVIPDELVRGLVDSPEIAWGLKQDIAHGLAVAADRAFLQGDPDGLAPVGIRRTVAVAPNPAPHDPTDVLQVVRTMVGAIRRREQVRFGNAGWILHPYWVDALTRLLTADYQEMGWGTGLDAASKELFAPDGRDGGVLLGFPFISTWAATGDRDREDGDPDDADLTRAWIHFSADWSEAWVGARPDVVTVDVSVDAHFQSDETVVRAVVEHDFLVRRPRFFTYADAPNAPMELGDDAPIALLSGCVPTPPHDAPAPGRKPPPASGTRKKK
jgi:Phage capsid family